MSESLQRASESVLSPTILPSEQGSINSPFEVVPMPANILIRSPITRREEGEIQMVLSGNKYPATFIIVPGFEDVIGEQLGGGFYYNHSGTVNQLAFALAVSPHPAVSEMVEDRSMVEHPEDAVRVLREQRVLEGLRIMDLGCGMLPGFALAAKTLGAETFTADAEDLRPNIKAWVDGHTVVDFNTTTAPAKLARATGSNFDIVTENIVGSVPGRQVDISEPDPEAIIAIGKVLLKPGGYLYGTTIKGLRDKLLRKI